MVYVCLGFVILVEVIGIYSEIGFRFGVNKVFARVAVLMAHFLSCITISFQLYHPGMNCIKIGLPGKLGPNSIEKNPTEKPTEKPTENPTEKPTENPTEIPYTKKKSKNG